MSGAPGGSGRNEARGPGGKSASAFRTISEVSDDLGVPQHVLRFWETKFSQVRPLKRGGGRRYYRPEDVELLRRIHQLLYQDGYTIRGVQRLLKENLEPAAAEPPGKVVDGVADPGLPDATREALRAILEDLRQARALLGRLR